MSIFGEKRVLIYGGAKGIGRAVALELARRGAHLAIADIDHASARETAQLISDSNGISTAILCDVTSEESVSQAASEAENTMGDIDIVINNVGVILSGYPEDIPLEEWQRIINLNLMPVIRSNAVFLPKMLARGRGHIVNTASFAGLYPYAVNRMPYVASKAAVVALTESLAIHRVPVLFVRRVSFLNLNIFNEIAGII